MRSFDDLGVFWLAGYEDDTLSGQLQFDPAAGGIDLSLVGTFDRAVDSGDATVRLNGWVGHDRITLDRCFGSGSTVPSPGVDSCKFYANRIFLGHHFGQTEDLAFKSATIEISGLDSWVGRTGIASEDKPYDWRDETPSASVYEMSFTPPAVESHTFSRGEISLRFRWKRDGQQGQQVDFRQWPTIRISYAELQPFEVIRKDIGRIQNIVTLCVDAPTSADRITLTRPDIKMRALSGDEWDAPQSIDFIAPPLRYLEPKERKPRHWFQMLLTYDELGGIPAIARWLDVSQEFQRALDSMMSTRHAKQMFAENRFTNITYAAEAFHRITQHAPYMDDAEFSQLLSLYLESTPPAHHDWLRGKIGYGNEPPLVKRLRQLAGRSAAATRPLVGDKGSWAGTLSAVRNELTHLGAQPRVFDGGDLYFLSESVYAVLRICMLHEVGVAHETLAAKANADSMTWYGERLKRSLAAVRAELADN